jgi:hypothetical protein
MLSDEEADTTKRKLQRGWRGPVHPVEEPRSELSRRRAQGRQSRDGSSHDGKAQLESSPENPGRCTCLTKERRENLHMIIDGMSQAILVDAALATLERLTREKWQAVAKRDRSWPPTE